MGIQRTLHRRRIKAEEKTKVVAVEEVHIKTEEKTKIVGDSLLLGGQN